MPDPAAEEQPAALTLVERKQRAARQRIIEAADALFAERGFGAVSVTDIAERAEVGRTTFFRLFTDKTEVVFAQEQAMTDAVTAATAAGWDPGRSVTSLAGAVSALEPLVLRLCALATADLRAYRRHVQLVDAHEELRAREVVKHQQIAKEFADALVTHGAPLDVATLAGQLAVACYSSGRLLATDPADLVSKTATAFRSILAIRPTE